MKLLPTTQRGTWLLAVGVWFLACVGLWYALPGAPRETVNLPLDSDLVDFGPGGETALVRREISRRDFEMHNNNCVWALELLELPSGRLVTTFVDRFNSFWGLSIIGKSADRRIWLVNAHDRPDDEILKLDLTSRTVEQLPARLRELDDNWSTTLAHDGRLGAFPDPIPHEPNFTGPGTETVFWDIEHNRQKAVLAGPYCQFAFSADSRLAVAELFKQDGVRIFDVESLTPAITISGPAKQNVGRVILSPDGSRVAVEFTPEGIDEHRGIGRQRIYANAFRAEMPHSGKSNYESVLFVGETANGRVREFGPLNRSQFVAGGRALVGYSYADGDNCLRAYDITTGDLLYAISVRPFEEWEVSPDGRTLLHVLEENQPGIVEQFARAHGIPWPFAAARTAVGRLYNAANGHSLGRITARGAERASLESPIIAYRWFPDGQTLATMPDPDHPNVWQLWDIPPRKSLNLFALAAAVLALPIAWFARRRVRRLRREAA